MWDFATAEHLELRDGRRLRRSLILRSAISGQDPRLFVSDIVRTRREDRACRSVDGGKKQRRLSPRRHQLPATQLGGLRRQRVTGTAFTGHL